MLQNIPRGVEGLCDQSTPWEGSTCFARLAGTCFLVQAVQRYISDNRRLLHSVYLLYASHSEDGALITLDQFRLAFAENRMLIEV